jgi:hypothetical protein
MMINEKSPSRPKRSFLPVVTKTVKSLHFRGDGAQYVGDSEPTWPSIEVQNKWTHLEYQRHLGAGLNWYPQTQDDKDIMSLAFNAIGLSGHFPELVVALKNSTVTFSIVAARIIRMAHVGLFLRFHERRFVVRAIRKCVNNQKAIADRAESTSRPNIQEYLTARVRKVRGEIDGTFDGFIIDDYTYGGLSSKNTPEKKPLAVVAQILSEEENTVPANRAKDLLDHCQRYLDEYRLALSGKNEYVSEAYSIIGKRKLKAAIAFWEQAIIDISAFSQQKQATKKTRKRKVKPASQIVSKLKFLKTFPDLKLESIEATKILSCTELWTYNTRLRKIGHYVSLNDAPFEVKGTRLTNIDPVKSVQKTLRKPADQLKEFGNYGKPGAIKWFNAIKAVATPLREAINGDSVVIRGVK